MNKSLSLKIFFPLLIFIIGISYFAYSPTADKNQLKLPKIVNNTISPRIIYIENPRFPKVETDDLWKVFQASASQVKEHFGVTMNKPDDIQVISIDTVFTDLIHNKPANFDNIIGSFRTKGVYWDGIKKNLVKQIKKQKDPLSKQIEFARPYLVRSLKEDTLEEFSNAVVETFKFRLSHWLDAKLDDGYPVIGRAATLPDLPYNEYAYWSLMAKLGIQAEIVLTNQLVASVEYMSIPIHTSIRGGITGGSTEYNPSSAFGSSVWVSLFPYLSNDKLITKLRNNQEYSRDEALFYAGTILAHELGHQLFQLGHPWSNKACIMRPAEVLDFALWVKNLDAKNCQIGSSPAMKPGVVKIRAW